ncbi:efflux transporter outer membrane subunit [Sphingomonas sp. JC676]|uniref:efflux transporter outer membrane subunit n=1 Tax=Sphingomonas sp. JC676 TaxID=2768065 RepID=UPI0016585A4B|nr:efflux transporter outer membrane subunit [Sphingomonas sp. JC676]MBC9032304.1 efflux transporter outer membrane subunit [Sphingomonas sp. JC676]
MRARTLLLLGTALALAACAGPRPEAPSTAAVSPPSDWRGGTAQPGAEVSATWWQGFGDPALTAIVDAALANNTDIAIAAARVEEARAQFRLSRAQQLPQVDATAGGNRQRALNAFGQGTDQTVSQTQLTISYDTDLFGRLANASAAARASLLSTEAARDNVRLAVAASAASGYIGLRALDARLVVLQDTVAARREALHLAQRRAETGYAPMLDQRQAEAELAAAQALIPATELSIRRQEDALNLLLGENPRAIVRGLTLDALQTPQTPAALPSELLRRRPDIAQAEQSVVSADRSLDSARAAFLPSIRLSAAGGFVTSNLLPDPVTIFSLGGSILAPIFEGGRLHAQQDAAAARRDQAAFTYRKTALTAFREVEDSLAAVDRVAEQERVIEAQRISLAEVLRLATNRYRAGYSPYLEQLDAQRALLSAELSLVQARSDRLSASVSLYQALGGGWSPDALR